MIRKMKRTGLTLLLALLAFSLAAQETGTWQPTDTAFVFRFVPQKDVFYVPFRQNEAELKRLCDILRMNINRLNAGQMYVSINSYAASAGLKAGISAQRMAYLRNSRVKSELILRAGITEKMFVTDKLIPTAYADSLRNVVVVTFPAGVDQVKRLAGSEAAEGVRIYQREVEQALRTSENKKRALAEQRQQASACLQAKEADRKAAEAQAEAQRQATAEHERLEAEEQKRLAFEVTAVKSVPYTFALRANLLRWATLTPDLGAEWRISRDWSVEVDGTWTSWNWDNKNRRYALWEVSPAIHYYIGKQKRGYVGVMYHIGQFNYKLSDAGKQGDLQGGGIVGGYMLNVGKRLMLDFNLGIGCTHADYDAYVLTEGVKVRTGSGEKNYWGINKAGVTLAWKIY